MNKLKIGDIYKCNSCTGGGCFVRFKSMCKIYYSKDKICVVSRLYDFVDSSMIKSTDRCCDVNKKWLSPVSTYDLLNLF